MVHKALNLGHLSHSNKARVRKKTDFPKGKMKNDIFLRGKIRKTGNIWIEFAKSPKVNW